MGHRNFTCQSPEARKLHYTLVNCPGFPIGVLLARDGDVKKLNINRRFLNFELKRLGNNVSPSFNAYKPETDSRHSFTDWCLKCGSGINVHLPVFWHENLFVTQYLVHRDLETCSFDIYQFCFIMTVIDKFSAMLWTQNSEWTKNNNLIENHYETIYKPIRIDNLVMLHHMCVWPANSQSS